MTKAEAVPPPNSAFSVRTVSSALAASTSAMTTRAPLAASIVEVPPPIPREPPVTIATCPARTSVRNVGSMSTSAALPDRWALLGERPQAFLQILRRHHRPGEVHLLGPPVGVLPVVTALYALLARSYRDRAGGEAF